MSCPINGGFVSGSAAASLAIRRPGQRRRQSKRPEKTFYAQLARARAVVAGECAAKAIRFVKPHAEGRIVDNAGRTRAQSTVGAQWLCHQHLHHGNNCGTGPSPNTTTRGTTSAHFVSPRTAFAPDQCLTVPATRPKPTGPPWYDLGQHPDRRIVPRTSRPPPTS